MTSITYDRLTTCSLYITNTCIVLWYEAMYKMQSCPSKLLADSINLFIKRYVVTVCYLVELSTNSDVEYVRRVNPETKQLPEILFARQQNVV